MLYTNISPEHRLYRNSRHHKREREREERELCYFSKNSQNIQDEQATIHTHTKKVQTYKPTHKHTQAINQTAVSEDT